MPGGSKEKSIDYDNLYIFIKIYQIISDEVANDLGEFIREFKKIVQPCL